MQRDGAIPCRALVFFEHVQPFSLDSQRDPVSMDGAGVWSEHFGTRGDAAWRPVAVVGLLVMPCVGVVQAVSAPPGAAAWWNDPLATRGETLILGGSLPPHGSARRRGDARCVRVRRRRHRPCHLSRVVQLLTVVSTTTTGRRVSARGSGACGELSTFFSLAPRGRWPVHFFAQLPWSCTAAVAATLLARTHGP